MFSLPNIFWFLVCSLCKKKNGHHNFSESNLTSSNCLICVTHSWEREKEKSSKSSCFGFKDGRVHWLSNSFQLVVWMNWSLFMLHSGSLWTNLMAQTHAQLKKSCCRSELKQPWCLTPLTTVTWWSLCSVCYMCILYKMCCYISIISQKPLKWPWNLVD